MPIQLVPAGGRGKPVRLDKAIFLFGRHPDCDVVITSSRKVSRKHCCLAQVNSEFVVRDLGSMNGIRVNGSAVKRSVKIQPGDELMVGDVIFHVKDDATNGKATKARKPTPASPKPVPKHMISQDIPVIIPDEAQSFAVEESVVKSTTDSDIPIELSADDIVDDESEWEIEVNE